MKFIVFYLQLINSREGLGMFFSSAFLIRRLRKYTATHVQCSTALDVIQVFLGEDVEIIDLIPCS